MACKRTGLWSPMKCMTKFLHPREVHTCIHRVEQCCGASCFATGLDERQNSAHARRWACV
eukprot:2983552-Pleurochrysis_carterae.AAC.1